MNAMGTIDERERKGARSRAAALRPTNPDLIDQVRESIVVVDLDGRITGWNKASEAIYGWQRSRAEGQAYEAVLGARDWPDAGSLQDLDDEGSRTLELRRKTASGEDVIISARLTLRRDASGAPCEWVEFGVDVTAQRRAELAVEAGQRHYRNVIQAMPASLSVVDFSQARLLALEWMQGVDPDQRRAWLTARTDHVRQLMAATYCRDVNDYTIQLFRPNGLENMLVSIDHFWPSSTIPDYIDWIVSALAGEIDFSREIRQRRADGFEFDALFTSRFAPGTIEQGQFIVTIIDYSEIKRTQEAIRQSEAFYTDMFHGSAFSAWRLDATAARVIYADLHARGVTDFRGEIEQDPTLLPRIMEAIRVVDVNETSVKLFESRDRAEMIGSSISHYWSPDHLEPIIGSLEASFNNIENYRSLARMRTLKGNEIEVLYTRSSSGALRSAGELLLAIVDITDKVRAQGALAEMQATLAHAARVSSLGELTASIAHEVNQPLAAISANGSAALSWLSRSSPDLDKVRVLTEEMIADATRASQVVSHIRSMASPQVGQYSRLCLSALTADALSLLADQLARRDVVAARDLRTGLPDVMGDTVQLQQVVVNLVLNALQAMSDKPGSRVTLRTRAEGEEVVLSVEDNGPGIPTENLDKLFGSFFTTKADGMGIGLAICRTIVEAHGGSISVRNLDRGGASFTVRLPSAP